MQEFWFFSLLVVTVLAAGGLWLLRSALRRTTVEEPDPDEPVVVAGPGANMAIEVRRSKLEAMGILAYARNRTGRVMPGGVPPPFSGWELLVRRQDVDDAERILHEDA
jgi:hypothetical protein